MLFASILDEREWAIHALKDVFFIANALMKGEIRAQKGELAEQDDLVAHEIAWACVDAMRNVAA